MDIFDTINRILPPEFTRIAYLIILIYTAYKVTIILDLLVGAIVRAERDRKLVTDETLKALTTFNKNYNNEE